MTTIMPQKPEILIDKFFSALYEEKKINALNSLVQQSFPTSKSLWTNEYITHLQGVLLTNLYLPFLLKMGNSLSTPLISKILTHTHK